MNSSSGRVLVRQIVSSLRAATTLQNQQSKRYVQQQSNAVSEAHDKCSYYTPSEGYIRTSPFDPVAIPDLTLDRYVWENVNKWQNKIAAVSTL